MTSDAGGPDFPLPPLDLTDLAHDAHEPRFVVYEARNGDGEPIYVGRSGRFGRRLSTHSRNAGWFDEIDTIKVHHCGSAEHMAELEVALIRSLLPPGNKTEHHPPSEYDRETLELHESYLRHGFWPRIYGSGAGSLFRRRR